jgi:hypothetical protein
MPGGDRLAGRWTMLNTAVSYHFWNDSVEAIMYPPQAPAPPKYGVAGDSIVIIDGERASRYAFALRGDTLRLSWPAGAAPHPMTRVTGGQGLTGSWRSQARGLTTVLTFRSDSMFVMETGLQPGLRRGDTLIINADGKEFRTLFYFANNRLNARSIGDRGRRTIALVRRPWGCFGLKQLDGKAAECR